MWLFLVFQGRIGARIAEEQLVLFPSPFYYGNCLNYYRKVTNAVSNVFFTPNGFYYPSSYFFYYHQRKRCNTTHQTEGQTKERCGGFVFGDLTHERGPLTSWTRTGEGSTTWLYPHHESMPPALILARVPWSSLETSCLATVGRGE